MRHHKVMRWEKKLHRLFDRIDDYLEDQYGASFPLHPARASRGSTSSKGQDGLFAVGASYSAGFGSSFGPGYVVEVRLVTLARVPPEIRTRIEEEVVDLLTEALPKEFPGRKLQVERDGSIYKIYGDLGLGKV